MRRAMTFFLFSLAFMLFSSPSAFSLSTGKTAPDFSLPDADGKTHKLSSYRGKYVILEWFNHECPFVRKHYDSNNMQNIQKELTQKEVVWLTINSSAPKKQGHLTPQKAKKVIQEENAKATALLLDPEGKVGRLYNAKTTPHMFVINPKGLLIYQGAIDDKPSTSQKDLAGAKNFVRVATLESMAGKPVSNPSTKPYGCSVKYP